MLNRRGESTNARTEPNAGDSRDCRARVASTVDPDGDPPRQLERREGMGRKRAIRARGRRGVTADPTALVFRRFRFGNPPSPRARCCAPNHAILGASFKPRESTRGVAPHTPQSRSRGVVDAARARAGARAVMAPVGRARRPRRRRRRRLPLPPPLAARDRGARPARLGRCSTRAAWRPRGRTRRGCASPTSAPSETTRTSPRERRRGRRWGRGVRSRSCPRFGSRRILGTRCVSPRASRDPSSGSAGISSIPKHHKRAVRPSPHRRLWNRRRRARRSSPRTRRRDASSRRVRSVDTEPEEEPIRAANSSVSAAFLHKSRRLVRAVEPRSIPNLDLVRPEFVARGVRAPDRALFFTGEPKAEVSWNRLSWRDAPVSAERSSSATSAWSRARRASIDDDTGEPDTTPDVRTADDENGTSEASRRDRVYVSAPPARRRRRSRSQKRSHKRGDDASGDASSVVVVPSAPVEVASDARLVLVALFVALFVALAFVAACAVALPSRRAARRARRRRGEGRGARRRRKRSGRGVDCGKASTPPAFRLGSIPRLAGATVSDELFFPRAAPASAAWPEARGERIRRGRRVRGARLASAFCFRSI